MKGGIFFLKINMAACKKECNQILTSEKLSNRKYVFLTATTERQERDIRDGVDWLLPGSEQ